MIDKPHLKRRKNDPLLFSMDLLRQALAVDCSNKQQQWAESLGVALAGVEQALHQNLVETVAQHGSLAMVDESTSSRQIEKLCQSESELLTQVMLLREEIRCATQSFASAAHARASVSDVPAPASAGADFASIRRSAEQILFALEQNREAESKLIQESFNIDVGVGD
jgi:hypothetical protein